MSRTEDNNDNKEKFSRPGLAAVINHELKGQPKFMFEFLGAGVGAEFYANEIEGLNGMVICDYDEEKIVEYEASGRYAKLPVPLKALRVGDAYEYFDSVSQCFNIINLDFCTFYYDNGRANCTSAIIDKVFEKSRILNGGIMMFTFQITGIGVNMHKTALKDKESIFGAIKHIAEKHFYGVELVTELVYKASKPTTMLNLVVKVNNFNTKV